MEDILNDIFRIVETHSKYGNSYHIEENVTIKNTWVHKMFGVKPDSKWKRLRFEHYTCIVNRQYGYESASYSYCGMYGAKEFLNLYIRFLKAEPVKYKFRTFKPMLYYSQQKHSLLYYDPKSYKSFDEHDYSYRTIGKLSTLKRDIDEKEVEGKLVKIHKIA